MKYDNMDRNSYSSGPLPEQRIDDVLTADEVVLWRGKPKKSVFVLENIVGMLPIAILWLAFDAVFITVLVKFSGELPKFIWYFIVPFFALHLMPVWFWISRMLTANKRYKNTEYCVTDKRVVIKSGFIGVSVVSIMFKDISRVDIRRGVLDTMFGVADLYISTNATPVATAKNCNYLNSIIDIVDATEVMKLIQKTAYDVQADINYPNAYRPDVNNGYNTKYNAQQNDSFYDRK